MDMNTKFHASCKHNEGRLVVDLNVDECIVSWAHLDSNKEPQDYGHVDIELYLDNTWLAYWETHGPLPTIPKKLKPNLIKLFKKIGMRDDDKA